MRQKGLFGRGILFGRGMVWPVPSQPMGLQRLARGHRSLRR